MNELGTEAIITPAGTLTALPSATGIVPADITKNLWQLGELSPGLLKALSGSLSQGNLLKNQLLGVTDDSFNVGVINMTVQADSTFDPDAWVKAIKNRAALSKNFK